MNMTASRQWFNVSKFQMSDIVDSQLEMKWIKFVRLELNDRLYDYFVEISGTLGKRGYKTYYKVVFIHMRKVTAFQDILNQNLPNINTHWFILKASALSYCPVKNNPRQQIWKVIWPSFTQNNSVSNLPGFTSDGKGAKV